MKNSNIIILQEKCNLAPLLSHIAIQITCDQKTTEWTLSQPNIKQVHWQHSLSVCFGGFYFVKPAPTTEMLVWDWLSSSLLIHHFLFSFFASSVNILFGHSASVLMSVEVHRPVWMSPCQPVLVPLPVPPVAVAGRRGFNNQARVSLFTACLWFGFLALLVVL